MSNQPSSTPSDPAPVQPPAIDRALPALALLQVLLLTAGWGGNAPALRYSLHYLPPFSAAGMRFLLGMGVVVVLARLRRVSLRVRREEWLPLMWLGVLFTVQIALLNYGSARTEANRQALLINSYPLFVPLLAHFFLRGDRLTAHKIGGTLLAFAGVLIVFGEKVWTGRGAISGDLLVAGSALLLAVIAVYSSSLLRSSHPFQVLFWQMAMAIPCFFGLSLVFEPQRYQWSAVVAVAVLYQGLVVGGLCFMGWTSLLGRYSPSRLSVGFLLTPMWGSLFSFLLLGEPITPGLAVGGAAVLLGLLLVNRSRIGAPPHAGSHGDSR
ncbi:MAG TPA: DMT family transporter [Armatimonadota bacterium]|nr:DMT family transporter [Armatimonadota bacterium]